jgi:DNA-binding NarL/FixJ family response regulator
MTLGTTPDTVTSVADTPGVLRVLLVDAQQIFRQGLQALFAAERELCVVGETGQAQEALRLIGALKPDVVVTEVQLPQDDGVALIEQIHTRYPHVGILVLTAARARDVVAAARKAGARGYLLKDSSRDELMKALREVAAGGVYRLPVSSAPSAPSASGRAAHLTARQREVLGSLALGISTPEIARMLGVSVPAVHKHREALRHILQLHSTAALTRFAVCEGLAPSGAAAPRKASS